MHQPDQSLCSSPSRPTLRYESGYGKWFEWLRTCLLLLNYWDNEFETPRMFNGIDAEVLPEFEAQNLIRSSISPELLDAIGDYDTAYEFYLKIRGQLTNVNVVFIALRNFLNMSSVEGESIESYTLRFDNAYKRLIATGYFIGAELRDHVFSINMPKEIINSSGTDSNGPTENDLCRIISGLGIHHSAENDDSFIGGVESFENDYEHRHEEDGALLSSSSAKSRDVSTLGSPSCSKDIEQSIHRSAHTHQSLDKYTPHNDQWMSVDYKCTYCGKLGHKEYYCFKRRYVLRRRANASTFWSESRTPRSDWRQ